MNLEYLNIASKFKVEMNRIPEGIANVFKPLRLNQVKVERAQTEILPGCLYFQTGSSRWDIDEKDSDIDIVVLPYWISGIDAWHNSKTGAPGPNTIAYEFFRDHPDRCDDDRYSSSKSVKLLLTNGKKVDAIVVHSVDMFLEWYYATRQMDRMIDNKGYQFDGLNMEEKSDRVNYFEIYRNEFNNSRMEKFWNETGYYDHLPEFMDDLAPMVVSGGIYSYGTVDIEEDKFDQLENSLVDTIDKFLGCKIAEVKEELQKAVQVEVQKMFEEHKIDIKELMDEGKPKSTDWALEDAADEVIELLNKTKELDMSHNLEVEVVEKLDSAKLIAAVPGVGEENIDITVDNEDNIIYISVEADEQVDEDVKDTFDLAKEARVTLNKKYDVNTAKVALANGILTISVATNKGRIKKIKVGK